MTENNNDDFHKNSIVRVERDGSKVYIPKTMLGEMNLGADWAARIGVAVIGGGALACAAINLLNDIVVNCGQEKWVYSLMDLQSTLTDCLFSVEGGFPYYWLHIFK